MSGFVGYLSNDIDKKVIKKMNNRIKHRGIDLEDYYYADNICIGYRGNIIEKKDDVIEPMELDNIVAVMDGRFYNYESLRNTLEKKKYKFKTDSDIELLINGFKEWKYDVVNKIDGMFSIMIWNKDNNELFLARDKWGIKPIYYGEFGGDFIFGSEIKTFIEHPKFNKELNENILSSYLCFNSTPTEETFFKNVYRIEPGNYLVYKGNKKKIVNYYKLKYLENETDKDKIINEIKSGVEKSLKSRILEREVGSFLSSGVDSSYLVSLSKVPKTFTVGYEEKIYDESEHAKNLCKELNITNKVAKIKKEDYIKEFREVIYNMDEPVADPSAISLYFGAKAASKDVRVVFSGEGADEFFGGYNYYKTELDESWYLKVPYFIRNIFYRISSLFPDARGFNFLYRNGQKIEDFNIGLGRVFRDKEALSVVKNKEQIMPKDILKPIYEEYKNNSNIVKKQVVDYYYWLVRDFLHIVDRNTSKFGMEARLPFISDDVFNVASKMDSSLKINRETTKVTFREAASSVIPNNAHKKKKLGFPVPLRTWMKEDLFYNVILEKFNGEVADKYFEKKKIIKMLEQHRNNKKDNYKKIWAIYTFIIWYEEYFINN